MITTLSSTDGTPKERAMRGAAVAMIVPSRFSMKNAPATSRARPIQTGPSPPPRALPSSGVPQPPRWRSLDSFFKARRRRSRPTGRSRARRGWSWPPWRGHRAAQRHRAQPTSHLTRVAVGKLFLPSSVPRFAGPILHVHGHSLGLIRLVEQVACVDHAACGSALSR